jgi:hypothetical protein
LGLLALGFLAPRYCGFVGVAGSRRCWLLGIAASRALLAPGSFGSLRYSRQSWLICELWLGVLRGVL